MRAVLDNGLIIIGEDLTIDLEETKNSLMTSHKEALALSLEIAFPTSENTEMLLQSAHQKAYLLSLNAAIPTKENIKELILKAYIEMQKLKNITDASA